MRYETIQTLKDEDLKRSTFVSRAMFEKMLSVVKAGLRDFGRTPKLIHWLQDKDLEILSRYQVSSEYLPVFAAF